MRIVISGTTGVGKSTTVSLLKKKLEKMGKKVTVVGELVADSPYFDLYFNQMSEWAFIAQVDFLMERFRQYMIYEDMYKKDPNQIIIYDRHFLEDKIFADLHIVKQNTNQFLSNAYNYVLKEVLSKMNLLGTPDYFIMLKADFDTVKGRMEKRGRPEEATIDVKYWKDLYWRYYNASEYRKRFKDNTKHFVEFLTDDLEAEQTAEAIIKYISKRTKI